jgi:hypothetical protein
LLRAIQYAPQQRARELLARSQRIAVGPDGRATVVWWHELIAGNQQDPGQVEARQERRNGSYGPN